MTPEKIKNYNQKLLAVLGTIVVVGLVFTLIGGIVSFVSEYFSNYRDSDYDRGLITGQQLSGLQKDSLRGQIISYDMPLLIDTANSVYLIPVVPKDLKNPERYEEVYSETVAEPASVEESTSLKMRKKYESFGKEYTNMLIYMPSQNTVEKLFSGRILLTSIETYYFKDEILIAFEAIENDDNKDGRINIGDFKSLYFYSLKNKETRRIKEQNSTIRLYEFMENSKDILIEFGLDRNKDGKYDYHSEPCEIRKYNFEKQTLENIIPNSLHNEMQKLVEGI